MKKLEDFNELLKSLKESGIDVPKFQRVDDLDCYFSTVVDKDIPSLDLDVGLILGIEYKHNPVSAEDLITKELTMEVSGLDVLLKRLCTFEYISVDTEYWHAVPDTVNVEVDVINKLESFFSKLPEGVAEAQNVARDLGSYKTWDTWGKFYGDMVKKGKFRWANLNGEEFPYVITNLQDLSNYPGISLGGLYFIAKESAPELWQEQIIAYHERFCLQEGCLSARKKEFELAKILGVGKEHAEWRSYIDRTYGKQSRH